MAKFTFICSSCQASSQRYVSSKVESLDCPACSGRMNRQFPSNGSQKVLEVVDPFTNVKHTPDQMLQDKARKTEYFWEVEVPRLIQTYGIQTCLEEKWLVYNDKGELVINKPPSKR